MFRPANFQAYRYTKAFPKPSFPESGQRKASSPFLRMVPSLLITVGSLLLANVAWPILHYQFIISPSIQKNEYLSPVSQGFLPSSSVNVPPNLLTGEIPAVLGAEIDYSNPRNWFPSAQYQIPNQAPETYLLSIPSLNIHNAKVIVGGDDLNKGLIHYPGTATPGQLGSPVIFGHSILRQFYNPREDNPQRYKSIFSTIMTLKNGEFIYIDYDGIRYTYEVKEKVEVQPEDTFILEQRYNNRELKLITCVPEGTYLRRGVIIAQLVNLSDPINSDHATNW
jgi:sortase A